MGAPDWTQMRREYEEQGLSFQLLASRYGVPKTNIIRRAHAEGWQKWTVDRSKVVHAPDLPPRQNDADTTTLARDMVVQLAEIAQKETLDLRDHKLFADALSQYNKIIVTAPPAGQDDLPGNVDWSIFTPDELAIIQPIFAQAEARRAAELEQQNITPLITPLRKQA